MRNRLAAATYIVLWTLAGQFEPGPDVLAFLNVARTNTPAASDIRVSIAPGVGGSRPAPHATAISSDGYGAFPLVCPRYFSRDFTAFHRMPQAALTARGATIDVRYVANSGMLVTVSDRRFLIDAPIREGIPPYATSPAAERTLLEGARPPYAQVDAILITHWHEDHFSAAAVAAHLSSSSRTILVSAPEVVDRVRSVAPGLPASQTRAVLPAPGREEQVEVGGIPVHVLRIRHNPSRRLPEQHVGFLIGGPAPVLHVGDADPGADNFALLKSLPPVDLALVPFWYLVDEPNRRFVAESIRPRRIVAMHVPPRDAQKIGVALRDANVAAEIASRPGSPLATGR